jgi:glycosyltransferase involved in cell wall biosynthesis
MNADAITAIVHGLQQDRCIALSSEIELIAMLQYGILKTAPDVVVSLIDLTNVRVLAAMYGTGVPVVACEQTDCSRVSVGKWQSVRKAIYRRAHAVVAPHPAIAAWLSRHGARARSIPNPLIAPPPMRGEPNAQPNGNLNGKHRRLVTLARLSREKRPELLVRAFASIAADFPEWELEFHGDGPMRAGVARYISEMAPGRIHLHNFVDAPYSILDGADLFVSTSWVEGFGNAIWEALACGVPVVAMEAGAPVRSLVRDGVDGLIVHTNRTPALAAALASLMGDDAARASLAARAPEVVYRFSMESALQQWDELLGEVVTGR